MILVCGGAGYIGSHTTHELVERGFETIVFDNLQSGHRAAVHPKAAFFEGDVRDGAALDAVMAGGVDEVIHFAADSLVGESVENPLKYYDNNVHGMEVLLKAMVRNGVRRIVFSSTAAVYGEPARVPILESDPTVPANPYGETKLVMEKMMRWAARAHGLQYVSLRYFNVAGALADGSLGEDHAPETHLVPLIIQTALGRRESLSVFGDDYDTPDGTCIRDYVHVTDLARAHLLALDYLRKGGASDIFNLGGAGGGFSVKEMIESAERVSGKSIRREIKPRRPGDPARLAADSSKARETLGWKPEYENVDDVIATAWKWHESHPNGWGVD